MFLNIIKRNFITIVKNGYEGRRYEFGKNGQKLIPGIHLNIPFVHKVATTDMSEKINNFYIYHFVNYEKRNLHFQVTINYRVMDSQKLLQNKRIDQIFQNKVEYSLYKIYDSDASQKKMYGFLSLADKDVINKHLFDLGIVCKNVLIKPMESKDFISVTEHNEKMEKMEKKVEECEQAASDLLITVAILTAMGTAAATLYLNEPKKHRGYWYID